MFLLLAQLRHGTSSPNAALSKGKLRSWIEGRGTIAPDELYFILLKRSAWGSSCPSCSSTVPVHYFRDPNVQALFLIRVQRKCSNWLQNY
jgi:hypothetical protein